MMSYRNRVLLLVLAALLSVALVATVWVVDVAGRERDRQEGAVRANAERVLLHIDSEIARQISALEALATSPLIDAGDLEGFKLQVERANAHQPLWHNIILATPDGRQAINLRYPPSRVTGMRSFTQVIETGRPAVSNVLVGLSSGIKSVAVRVPVPRGGEVRYVLTAGLDVEQLAGLFMAALPHGWSGVLIDRNGRIILRSSDGAKMIGEAAAESARSALEQGREGELRTGASRSGTPFVTMHLRSPLTGWTAHAGFPLSALSIFQTNSVLFAIAGAVASLLLGGLLSYLILREVRLDRRHMSAIAESERLEAVGQIAAGVAHDFNNLLMIIQGTAHMIRRRKDQPDAILRLTDAVTAAAQRGGALTKQLLTYGRKGLQSPVSFDLRERAEDLTTLLSQSTRGDIRTELVIPDDVWPIFADPTALEVALINLATNARDAMPHGGRLIVSASNVTLHGNESRIGLRGDYIEISMTDTGSGIEAKNLSRVFEPFFTTKETGYGTGLGLSQVYGFTKQSGGTVVVESTAGQGTTFTLYLPRSREPASPTRRAGAVVPLEGAGRVLLVEDNADVCQAIAAMLEHAGFAVATAGDSNAALDLIDRSGPFDCVLTDIVMPGAPSGLELEAQLRARDPSLPVVLMTGYSEALARGQAMGRRVLSKPFAESELIAALKQAIAAREAKDWRAAAGE